MNHLSTEHHPLMVNGNGSSNMSGVKVRRRGFPILLVVAAVLVISSIVIVVVVRNALTGTDYDYYQTAPSVASQIKYSRNAKANLEQLFNERPPTKTEVGCNGTIIIIPHCELNHVRQIDPKDKEYALLSGEIYGDGTCNVIGVERSYYLITQFGDGPEKRWPIPRDIIVVGDESKRQRAIDTVLPLQRYYNVTGRGDNPIILNDRNSLVQHLGHFIRTGDLCGNVVVVASAFVDDIPKLAFDLGCGPLNSGCPMTFEDTDLNQAWELHFLYDRVKDAEGNIINSPDGHHHRTPEDKLYHSHDTRGNDKPRWQLFGNVVNQNFDPLAFSKKVKDFAGGNEGQENPRWMNMSIYDDLH